MNLSNVLRGTGRSKSRRRRGRGTGSRLGKTAGRGHKGQKSRSGWSRPPVFQCGTMPLVRRVPKRGFNNKWALKVAIVNLDDLQEKFASGDKVNPETLEAKGFANSRYDELKILGNGELKKKLKVSAHRFSKSAREKIEQAGGEVIVLAGKKSALPRKQAKEKQTKK